MNKKLWIGLTLTMLFSSMTFTGCSTADQPAPGTTTQTDTTKKDTPKTDAKDNATTEEAKPQGPDDTTNPYTFTLYYNYDWWTLKQWAQDEASKFLAEKFNVQVEFAKPDADPAAKLNLMISSGDLPDAIMTDRNADLLKLAKADVLVPLDQLKYEGNPYDDNILPQTQELLKSNGTLYSIPNWARKGPTGGNDSWMVNEDVYEAVGSPELKTLEDLHAYALAVKNANLKNPNGETILPFMTGETKDGAKLIKPVYRSKGGNNLAEGWYVRKDGKLQFAFRDELFKETLLELNKWYNEGLFSETVFTDTPDQTLEKLTNGRPGLLWYDFSQDSVNRFRTILQETTNGENTYNVLTEPVYPPAEGVTKVYGDDASTPGWNVTVITQNAENPQRIFDLYSYMLTKEGSINMMYGPQGQLWDELDAEGNPILKTPESQLTSDEKTRLGLWMWAEPGHSDNVDLTKFAVNAALPEADRDWVISLQSDVFTPTKFITDENVGLSDTIDPQSDLGVRRKMITDRIESEVPKIIMAKDEATAIGLYDKLLAFAEENGVAEIETAYDAKHQENVKLQGFSAYDK